MNPALLYIYSFPFFSSNSADDDSFPYREPGVIELLVLSSFLFLLNVVRVVADHFLHAGIIAEIILGMVYGEPIAGILPTDWEGTFTVLGYLGLIGIVFEGGLSTNLDLLVANLPLSVLCASIGIGFPVAFSFALLNTGYGYKSLESFAAGAALCSTSLGTTLMALSSVTGAPTSSNSASSSDKARQEKQEHAIALSSELQAKETGEASEDVPLQKSRIGTVLISSAVIDDVIGLVLSSLVPALSAIDDTRSHSNLAWKVVRPMLSSVLMATITPIVARYILRPVFRFRNLGHRWCTPRLPGKSWGSTRVLKLISGPRSNLSRWGAQHHADGAGVLIMILTVSAFAAIAFYGGSSVLFGAYLAGLTVTYLQQPPQKRQSEDELDHHLSFEEIYVRTIGPLQRAIFAPLFFASIGYGIPFLPLWRPAVLWRGVLYALLMAAGKLVVGLPIVLWALWSNKNNSSSSTERLKESIFPALFIGVVMVARGEIGLLIAQIAREFEGSSNSAGGLLGEEAFLVCIWAILLCTLLSPIGVGYIVNRWKNKIVHGIWR